MERLAMSAANPTPAQIEALARFEAAINLRDASGVEAAMADVLHAGVDLGCSGLQARMCSLLISLVNAHWHTRHEVVIACTGMFRCAEAVPALEEAAHASMTSNDLYCTLARMCCRAFAHIGTPEARAALERLSDSGCGMIA
jgi:hypothetical protein